MVEPNCMYFGECGGCSLQHIEYQTQLNNKKNYLKGLLKLADPFEVKLFSDKEYNYRNKMEFYFHPGGIGLRKKGKHSEIVDVHRCEIAEEKVNALLREVRSHFKRIDAYHVGKKTGTFIQAVIRASTTKTSISFILYEESQRLTPAIDMIRKFAETSTADNIVVSYSSDDERNFNDNDYFVIKGDEFLTESFMNLQFTYPTEGFFQNNTVVASKMQGYVHELLSTHSEKTKDSTLLDLYGGVGTFGLVNSQLFNKVIVAEFSEASIDAANKNIEKNSIQNAEAVVLDAKQLSNLELSSDSQGLFVILDPPRSGMNPKTIEELKRLKPEVIIYISCNPEQMAKDILKFTSHEVRSAAMFDMFPQTNHAEAIVELVKKK